MHASMEEIEQVRKLSEEICRDANEWLAHVSPEDFRKSHDSGKCTLVFEVSECGEQGAGLAGCLGWGGVRAAARGPFQNLTD
jgi:hypothetical protein